MTCNNCGGTTELQDFGSDTTSSYGLKAIVQGHYQSNHLVDLNEYHFSICEKCLRNMFDLFKIPPKVYAIGSKMLKLSSYEWDCEKTLTKISYEEDVRLRNVSKPETS